MTGTAGTDPERVAAEVLEMLPVGSRWLRAKVRGQEPTWSLPQLHALAYLQQWPGASLSDLAGYLGVGLPTASTLVSRLVAAGFLQRVEDPAERRKVSLSLTDSGRDRLDGAVDIARRELAGRLATLSERDLAKIMVAAARLRMVFEDPPPERAP